MKQISTLRAWIATGLLAGAIATAMGVPARPGLTTVTQPDGSQIQVRLVGDENGHYYLSEDGYLLVNTDGSFYFAEIGADGRPVASAVQAAAPAERSAATVEYLAKKNPAFEIASAGKFISSRADGRMRGMAAPRSLKREASAPATEERQPIGRYPGAHFPATGEQRAIVVLVEYQDVKFITENPLDYFSRMLNEEGFDTLGGTGSARDFFIENSNGAFRPTFDIYGPVTLKENMAYYGANDIYGTDMRPHEMAIEACQQLDGEVDFSQYDRDGDGLIDNVFIYYAGRGEATGGSVNTIWPHSWNLSTAEPDNVYEFDGVRLEGYGCTNEWDVNNGVERPDAIGIFVHEFSHVLGLPDLYNTVDQNACFTPGSWSTLDAGPYNNNSCTPPHYGAFERYALGWMQPEVVDKPATVTLAPIGENRAVLIPTSKEEEYFLLENRQQTGWDTYLPGHGMLIWHVDYNESVWQHNSVNNRSSHQYVDLEEADNVRTEATRSGDAFPGAAGITSFTESGSPSMLPWTEEGLDLPITEITEHADGTVTFLVGGGFILPSAGAALEPQEVGHDSFTARWAEAENALGYRLSIYEGTAEADLTPLAEWDDRDMGKALSAEVTGLDPETTYSYCVTPYNRCGDGATSGMRSVRTLAFTFDRRTPTALDATEVTGSSFVAQWEPLEAATGYTLDVYTKQSGRTVTDLCDFTDGTKAADLPEGWRSSSELSFAMAAYSGAATPSLRLGNTGDTVETPDYADDITSLSFWLRGSGTDDTAEVVVSGKRGGEWEELERVGADKALNGRNVVITAIPEGVTAMRLEFTKEGNGSVAIDDIGVSYTVEKDKVGYMSYDMPDSADRTSCKVEGLTPLTTYYYTVTASDGTITSRPSAEVRVRTTDGSGVQGVAAGAERGVRASDGTLIITCLAGDEVEVADVQGRILFSGAVATDEIRITLPGAGCYVVSVSGAVWKVIM